MSRQFFNNPNATVGVMIEALVGDTWHVIKRPQSRIHGGERIFHGQPQTDSFTYTTLPVGATHVRVEIDVAGVPASIATKVIFE